ncbi:hypothetical protein FOA52_008803 [Chlamydomonas sp. UWO 241]|nr:hypothetical protein FOA52_008803 [Chlamydomonas sp. UWO 241]
MRACRAVGERHREYDCQACDSGPYKQRNITLPLEEWQAENLLVGAGVDVKALQLTPWAPNCTHVFAACRKDGAGSQMMAKISAWAYSALHGGTYVHTPLAALDHYYGDGPTPTGAAKAVEDFFNLGQDETTIQEIAAAGTPVCGAHSCFHPFDDYLDGPDCWEQVKSQLRRKYDSSPKPRSFFSRFQPPGPSIRVAVHIRRGDADMMKATDGDRTTPNEFYVQVLQVIAAVLGNLTAGRLDVAVMSEGKPSDFQAITDAFPKAQLFLSEDLLASVHTLVTADVVVLAKSSLSYVAGIYNAGLVVYEAPWWHKPHRSWLIADRGGLTTPGSPPPPPFNATSLQQQLGLGGNVALVANRLKARRMTPLGNHTLSPGLAR